MEIDVSKCEYYTNVAGCELAECVSKRHKTITNFKCKYNKCYYKQLQKLKAENIELEQRLDDEMLRTTQLATENIKAEQKLEKIKECCNETKLVFNNSSGNDPYSQGRTIEAEHILEIIESEE